MRLFLTEGLHRQLPRKNSMINLIYIRSAGRGLLLLLGAVVLAFTSASVHAQSAALPPAVQMLVDRAAIHDLMVDYYAQIGTDDHDYSKYYTANGVLEVNGLIAQGKAAIIALYDRAGDMGESPPKNGSQVPPGRFNMMMANLKITVQGDTATAALLWFSIVSTTLTSPPAVTEHGHDRTQLVRRGGRWLISRRVVTSDGGMPDSELQSYLSR